MNIRSCLIILFYACGINLHAQEKLTERFSIKSGLGISQQSYNNKFYSFGNTHVAANNYFAPFINLQYAQPVKNRHLVCIGFQALEKGFRFNYTSASNRPGMQYTDKYEYAMRYLELPLTYGYRFTLLDKKAIVNCGVVGSYLYHSSSRGIYQSATQRSPTVVTTINSSYKYNRFNSWDIGIMYSLNIEVYKTLSIELSAQKHFIHADKLKQQEVMYNQNILLGLRYQFMNLVQ